MTRAFAFLIGTSFRNRLRRQAQRVRSPRYAIAFIVGLLYFVFILGGRYFGRQAGITTYATTGPAVAPLFIVVMVVSAWLLSADASALAFTQAEVSMLFTAPVSRRALIIYKLVSAQIAILISAMLMVFFLGRGSQTIPHVFTGIGYWMMLSIINMHGLGAALTRARSDERSTVSPAKRRIARMLAVLVSTMVMFVLIVPNIGGSRSGRNPFGFVDDVVTFLSQPIPHAVLTPFRWVVAPAFAPTLGDWLTAFLPGAAVLLLHLWWVLSADARFEEAAAEASERRAKMIEAMRTRRGTSPQGPTTATRTLPLASRGAPWIGIVWKNTLALGRLVQLNQMVMPLIVALLMSSTARRGTGGDLAQSVGIGLLFLGLMLGITGALVVRNDLRSDMLHLPFLKALPLRGRQIVFAEVVSGALPLAIIELILLIGASIAVALSTHEFFVSVAVRGGFMIASPLVLVAFNIAVFTVHNATAVMFPAWIRLGPTGGGGIELMGQAMMTMFGTLIAIVLLLVVPVVAAVGLMMLFGAPGTMSVAAALASAAVVLLAEAYGIIMLLGRSFERAEPTA